MRSADGVRFIRTPGSGILRNRTLFVQRVLKCIEPYQAAGKHIRYVADGHVDCGAGRVFAEDHGGGLDTDMVAKHELEERIAVLKEMGVDASFGVMLPLQASDREVMEYVARSVILDCTGGRFQDYRSSGMAHSFVVSSDDPQEAAQGVSTVMDIMQGRKGYNGELEAVNAVVFQDPERGKHSQTMLDGVVEIAKARADMEVRVIPHMAPRAA
jgi:hypothetical protein